MDTDEGTSVISGADNPFGDSVSSPRLAMPADPAPTSSPDTVPKTSVGDGEGAVQPDAGRELPTRMTDSVPGASSKEEVKGEHMEGVTPEHLSAPAEVLSLERMVGRFGKMVLNVTNGPRPSGDGETVDALNMGNLKTIKQSVATY